MIGKPPQRMVRDSATEFAEEHLQILALADRLEHLGDSDDFSKALQDMMAVLPGHLAEEERRDGLLDWIMVLLPKRGAEVEQLRADHDTMRNQLAKVYALSKSEDPRLAAAVLVALIHDHEKRESALVEAALSMA